MKSTAIKQTRRVEQRIEFVNHDTFFTARTGEDAIVIGVEVQKNPYQPQSIKQSLTMNALAYPSSRCTISALPALFIAMAVLLAFAPANRADVAKTWFEGGVFNSAAVRGYDMVAYFTLGRPVEGKREFTHTLQGSN